MPNLTGDALAMYEFARDYMIAEDYDIDHDLLEYTCKYYVLILDGSITYIEIYRIMRETFGIYKAGAIIHLLKLIDDETKKSIIRYVEHREALVAARNDVFA